MADTRTLSLPGSVVRMSPYSRSRPVAGSMMEQMPQGLFVGSAVVVEDGRAAAASTRSASSPRWVDAVVASSADLAYRGMAQYADTDIPRSTT